MCLMDNKRLFLAIELSQEIRRTLLEFGRELGQMAPGGTVRWVRPENIHLTLRFLGDTPVESLESIIEGMDRVAVEFSTFELALGKLGCFPNPRKPRIIWVDVIGELGTLEALQLGLSQMLTPLGWEPEKRRFHPHLTLGRVKDSRALIEARLPLGRELRPQKIHVDSIALIESTLLSDGAVYSTRHLSKLKQGKI